MPVYKDKKRKTWYVKIIIKGKQIFKRGFLDKKQALLYEAQALNSSTLKKRLIDSMCGDLSALYISYLNKKYKASSAYRYMGVYNIYIYPYFKDLKVSSITNFTLENYNSYINKLKLKDKKNIIFLAKGYITFLSRYGLDPSVNINNLYIYKTEYTEERRFDYYTIEEYDRFSNAISDIYYKLLFEMLFSYGLRIGELRGLKRSDIDLKLNKIYIKRAISNKTLDKGQIVTSVKTSSSYRDYPLLPKVRKYYLDYVNHYPKEKVTDFIFFSKKQKKKVIGETTIKREQIRLSKLTDLRVIKLHEFRHSCATYLFNKGADLELVASWLGHSDSSITRRVYAHLLPSRKNELIHYFNDP